MSQAIFTHAEVSETLKSVEDARWLTQRAYTDEEVFNEEVQRIFLSDWLPMFHAASLPNIGDFRTLNVLGRPLLFARDTENKIRCYLNICRHRGMEVASGTGNCERFVCPYHLWSFGLDGKIIKAPFIGGEWEDGTVGLTEVKCESLAGFVFIHLSEDDVEPLAKRHSAIADVLAPWNLEDAEMVCENTYEFKWNWKVMLENGLEAYHIMGIHPESAEGTTPANKAYLTEPEEAQGQYDILHTPFAAPYEPSSEVEAASFDIEGLPEWTSEEIRFYNIRPAAVIWPKGQSVVAFFVIPGATPRDTFVMNFVITSKKVAAHPDFAELQKADDALIDLVMQEDTLPCEVIDRTFEGSADWIPGPYQPQSEKGCWLFHQWYLSVMGVSES